VINCKKIVALIFFGTMTLISFADELAKGNSAFDKKDYADAIFWYNAAIKKNNFGAHHNLGLMYLNGTGVIQDYAKAYQHFNLAAEQGLPFSMHNLGLMYSNGWGVNRNYIYAHMWFNLSAMISESSSSKLRDGVAVYLSTQDVIKAQSFAKECLEKKYKNCQPSELILYKNL
jgi:TPR repeat protein